MMQFAVDKFTLASRWLISGFVILWISLFSVLAMAEQFDTPQSTRDFNHMTTGFPLMGLHIAADCTSCHVGGIFKGTPRTCTGCHAKGRRVAATSMSAKHIITTEPCEVCHTNTVTFYGAKFNHARATPGQCVTCHNGLIATGKAENHTAGLKATGSCDGCHRTFAWLPSTFNHSNIAPGTCSTCHNGVSAIGKPSASHSAGVRATSPCDACHKVFAWYPAFYSHASVAPGSCSTCHTGSPITGKPASHSSVSKATYACDTCHVTTGWNPAKYSHTGASSSCANCHNGATAAGKPSNHSSGGKSTLACENCHKAYVWSPAGFNHAGASSSCATCHNGTTTVGKGAKHVSTTAACEVCHKSTSSWSGASGHTGNETGLCLNCHISKRPSGHKTAAYLVSCDACHTTTSWSFNHAAQQGKHTCNSCHSKHNNATPCDNCHTVSSWDAKSGSSGSGSSGSSKESSGKESSKNGGDN